MHSNLYSITRNTTLATLIVALSSCQNTKKTESEIQKPNLVFVFADQWRAQSLGYTGNIQVKTPNLDKLASESVNLTNAISTCPVSSPYRACLITGQYPLTHGIFHNDKPLNPEITSIAKVYKSARYKTAYIGKWHINGHPKGESTWEYRLKPITKDRRQGFDFWKVLECTHDYNNSLYFDETDSLQTWDGYDAIAQTQVAIDYIKTKKDKPFILFLSWGPPHSPYETAPEKYREMYTDSSKIILRPNVPDSLSAFAQKDIAGYYAHITALDDCIANLQSAIKEAGIEKNTIFVFTSDHGDMLYSHAMQKKQKPWDESVHVPLLIKYPAKIPIGKVIDMPLGTPDLMPTLLGLSNINIPKSIEGSDFSGIILGTKEPTQEAALIMLPVPFHQWNYNNGGKEWRGVRSKRYTYVEDLNGAWLLYDNLKDPYQMTNLINDSEYSDIKVHLAEILIEKLKTTNDKFLSGKEYMKLWNYDED